MPGSNHSSIVAVDLLSANPACQGGIGDVQGGEGGMLSGGVVHSLGEDGLDLPLQ